MLAILIVNVFFCFFVLCFCGRPSSVDIVQMSALALEEPRQYEDISKYTDVLEKLPTGAESSTGEFSVAPCPAYMPTTRSAQLETEYDYVIAPIKKLMGPDVPGEGPPQGQGLANLPPEYEVVNVPDKDQTPKVPVHVDSEYETVNTGGSA